MLVVGELGIEHHDEVEVGGDGGGLARDGLHHAPRARGHAAEASDDLGLEAVLEDGVEGGAHLLEEDEAGRDRRGHAARGRRARGG